jgi:hypothetical protein
VDFPDVGGQLRIDLTAAHAASLKLSGRYQALSTLESSTYEVISDCDPRERLPRSSSGAGGCWFSLSPRR